MQNILNSKMTIHNSGIISGFLEVICGPMRSGKSKKLHEIIDRSKYLHCDFLLCKPKLDNRTKEVFSQYGNFRYPCILIPENNPQKILNEVEGRHKIVIIDETQFFSKGIRKTVRKLLNDYQKYVVTAGLDLDFRGEPFGEMSYLMSIANEVEKLAAVCEYPQCINPATRTQRLINDEPADYNSPIVSIEKLKGKKAKEKYEVRCLEHHIVPGRPK